MSDDDRRRIERIKAWGDLVVGYLVELIGPRPLLTLIIASVLVWGLVTEQAWAGVGTVTSPLLRALTR